ncbi:unnamed protein product [Colias eurytheme]|nr:unnamed protein product [Colias eurytheme]
MLRLTTRLVTLVLVSITKHLANVTLTSFDTNRASLGTLKHHVFIYRLYDKWNLLYRSFCTGSIITEERVLSSAHCFLTNRKRLKRGLHEIRVVGGILHTLTQQPLSHDIQQWRNVKRIHSQRFFRFPAYNLAIIVVSKKWDFNQFVNKIPYALKNQDFDGICMGVVLKPTRSWSTDKSLYTTDLKIHKQSSCEKKLLRCCWQYYCTEYDSRLSSTEAEGAGLICFGTGDPAEDEKQGLLVGVTSVMYRGLPSLHVKVGLFNKWVTDAASKFSFNVYFCIVILVMGNKLI